MPADSPRDGAEDKEHVRMLAALERPLPPILVDPRSLRVVDGMHRLRAAILRGDDEIEVELFEGPAEDAFLEGVRRNVAHGKPLTTRERERAAERLLLSHYAMSDRSLAEVCGLSSKTIGALRRRAGGDAPHLNKRVGRDGKMHPVDGSVGREAAARIIDQQPDASDREVARQAGIAPATASDVRHRVLEGKPAQKRRPRPNGGSSASLVRAAIQAQGAPAVHIDVVAADRALQSTTAGQEFIDWLVGRTIQAEDWLQYVDSIPLSRTYLVARIARQCAQEWGEFSEMLEQRARQA